MAGSQHDPRFLELVSAAREGVHEVDAQTVSRKLGGGEAFHLVDVREESEFAEDHVLGSIHIGRGVLERDIERRIPEPDAEIVLYCGGGYRSVLAAESLRRMGYRNVSSMAGGIRGWREAGLPTAGDAARSGG